MSFEKDFLDCLKTVERHEVRLDHIEKIGVWIMGIVAFVLGTLAVQFIQPKLSSSQIDPPVQQSALK